MSPLSARLKMLERFPPGQQPQMRMARDSEVPSWKSLPSMNAVKGMMLYWAIMAIATPLGLLRWAVIFAISIVHPRDTMMTRRTTTRITFRAVSIACCPNAKGGARLVREVLLCVQPGLQSSGLSKAPLVSFILLRGKEVPSSVSG